MSRVNRFLLKFNRYTAYILIPVILFMFVSGHRMTGNFTFISRGFADLLHRVYLNIVFLFLFLIHTFLSLRFLLMRRNIKGRWLDLLFILIAVFIFGIFSYLSLKLILPLQI